MLADLVPARPGHPVVPPPVLGLDGREVIVVGPERAVGGAAAVAVAAAGVAAEDAGESPGIKDLVTEISLVKYRQAKK